MADADGGADLGDTSALVGEPADVGAVAKARFDRAAMGEGPQILRFVISEWAQASGRAWGTSCSESCLLSYTLHMPDGPLSTR
jgi:hypothetical protein